jgi:hypothetical protein
MFPSLVLAAIGAAPSCWDIFDTALRHSAMASHPAYVSYDEHIHVTQDDQRLVQSVAHVVYRDDGLAWVRDERFDFTPILTRHEEPGPPELGPYGSERDAWIPQLQLLPTIADVRAQGDMSCSNLGEEPYKGHSTFHLRFAQQRPDRPSLKELWVDTVSHDIWKLIVSGYVRFDDDPGARPGLADFQVELGYAGPYLVVNHVVWEYSRRVYSQTSVYFAEYNLGGYSFPGSLPASYFGAI